MAKKINFGPFLIMLAASLWAIDAIFRSQLSTLFGIPSTSIVFFEHLLGFIILSPFLYNGISQIKLLKQKDWLVIMTMTVLSSVLGGILFTEALSRSFEQFDFVTPLLLQKLQPVFELLHMDL